MYSDSRELYVQLKDRPNDILDWADAFPILESFVHDELAARARRSTAGVGYRLVTTSIPVGAKLDQLFRGVLKRW